VSFKGLSSITVADAVKTFEREIGKSAAEHLNTTIDRVLATPNSLVEKLQDGTLKFAEDSHAKRFYRAIIDPLIYLPIDLTNSTLNLLKRMPGFKNSKFITGRLQKGLLKKRSDQLERFSNTMAIQHYFEMLGNNDLAKDGISKEAVKRFDLSKSGYTVKGERSLTRFVTGLIPAFFLANDAYNLSMYMNNNKDLAKKEKKKRFYQEVSRVLVTAAATFATLGLFSKRVSSNPLAATGVITALTVASEFIGRMLVGTPVHPLDKEEAKKYAKLQKKDKLKRNNDKKADSSSQINKKESKSSYVLKLLGAMIVAGFLIDKRSNIKPVRKFLNNVASKYREFFAKDYTIKREKLERIIFELRKNGFEKLADDYHNNLNRILKEGNLTTKEQIQVEREFEKRVEQCLPNDFIISTKKLKEAKKLITAKTKILKNEKGEEIEVKVVPIVKKEDVIKNLKFDSERSNKIINISGNLKGMLKSGINVDRSKDIIINGILALPIKFAWEVLNMPYAYLVKPLIDGFIKVKNVAKYDKIKELFSGKGKFKTKENIKSKDETPEEMFRNGVAFLEKNIDAPNFKEKVEKTIIDSFDNVNKSNISSAELGGSAKVAVSAATSAFLVLDNYNMVMIDSEGKDKKLAGQKAKERTLQRIVRIAYGASLIKLFNGVFKSTYQGSLLGAQTINTANSLVTETLERTSVGMPLHEATRDEIVEMDNEALNATGVKGMYFRFMARLTGKKPLSQKKVDK